MVDDICGVVRDGVYVILKKFSKSVVTSDTSFDVDVICKREKTSEKMVLEEITSFEESDRIESLSSEIRIFVPYKVGGITFSVKKSGRKNGAMGDLVEVQFLTEMEDRYSSLLEK